MINAKLRKVLLSTALATTLAGCGGGGGGALLNRWRQLQTAA